MDSPFERDGNDGLRAQRAQAACLISRSEMRG